VRLKLEIIHSDERDSLWAKTGTSRRLQIQLGAFSDALNKTFGKKGVQNSHITLSR